MFAGGCSSFSFVVSPKKVGSRKDTDGSVPAAASFANSPMSTKCDACAWSVAKSGKINVAAICDLYSFQVMPFSLNVLNRFGTPGGARMLVSVVTMPNDVPAYRYIRFGY